MRDGTTRGFERWSWIGLLALAGLVLVVGFLGTRWFGQRADQRHREALLAQASAIAQTVDPEQVKALSFSEADLNRPEFQRLRSQMRAFAEALGLRSLYSMALRDGKIVFGPESLNEDDPFASRPGTVYEEPSPLDFEALQTGRPSTQGPETDEYGTFISALAPVLDPHSGEVLLVVGIDVEATTWQSAISGARRTPILLALALLGILVAGGMALGWRQRRPAEWPGRLRYADAALCAAVGLVLTLAAAWLAHDTERHSRQESFSALARARAAGVVEDLRDLRGRLEDLARIFEGSERMDRDEFRVYVEGFARQGISQDWMWIPAVPAAAVAALEAEARREGLPGFEVWQPDPHGAPGPVSGREVYYPILYYESPAGREAEWGYDLGSEPLCRAAMEEAARTRMAAASDPVALSAPGRGPKTLFVFRPVSGRHPRGFVGVAVNPEALLGQAMRRSGTMENRVSAGLFLLAAGEPLRFLGSSSPRHGGEACWHEEFGGLSVTLPVFLFGRTYALRVHPEPAWLAANPLWSGGMTALAGLLLTALLTTLVALLANRRDSLEKQVRSRTASLRESEEKYRLLVENAGEAVFVAQDGALKFFNARCQELIGCPPEELTARPFVEFIHPDDRELVLSRHLRRLQDPAAGPPVYAFRIIDRQGNTRRVELNTASLSWEGRPATLNFMSDITERTALEDQFRHAQKMESVGRLAGGVAHDFNNMLAVIIGYAEMIMKELDPSEPLYGKMQQIHEAARRSADLTRQLLAFARRQTVQPKVLNLNDTVAGMLKMLQRLLGEDLQLVWKPGADLWPVEIDPSQVDQVLANLSVNARDAIGGVGTFTIETANVVMDDTYSQAHAGFVAGEFVLLMVSDTGAGMDKGTLEHLFEPFFTTKETGKGTGLGLATVYGIVKQNKGFINVYSEPGRGTTFKIYLSRAQAAEGKEAGAAGQEPAGGNETVLLVEDEGAVLELGRDILIRFGYTVLVAGNPREALDLAERHPGPIHLLITDVVMPEMNGKDMRDRVEEHRPGLKSLFMSGYTAQVIKHENLVAEDIHFLQKPFSFHTLAAAVRRALDPA